MEVDFEIGHVAITLKNMCAMKIAHQILMKCGIMSATEQEQQAICLKAHDMFRKLNLSVYDSFSVFKFFEAVILDMVRFYSEIFNTWVSPVYTLQGPINLTKSSEAILEDERVNRIFRFVIACEFCHVDYIMAMVRQLNNQEIAMLDHGTVAFFYKSKRKSRSTLAYFWMDAYRSNSLRGQLEDQVLLQRIHDDGVALALSTSNNVAIRYFIENASPEAVRSALAGMDRDRFLHCDKLLPATVCHVFSKLSLAQKLSDYGYYTIKVLDGLLKWPYQSLFLKTLRGVVSKLGVRLYSKVLDSIIRVLRNGDYDFNYQALFIESWKMGVIYWPVLFLMKDYSLSQLFDAFLTLNPVIIGFVINTVPDHLKRPLLLKFSASPHCHMLFLSEEFDTLKLIVKGFSLNRLKAILSFKDSFIEEASTNSRGIWRRRFSHPGSFAAQMQIFDKIIYDLIIIN